MYLAHYQLEQFPFALAFEPDFFYESAIHGEALANMTYAVQQRKGMVLVTGEVGSGKTFVGNVLCDRLGPSAFTVMLKNPPQSAKQLLRAVAQRTGLNIRGGVDKMDLATALEEHLLRLNARGRLVALLIDESQDLGGASLEELRLMWNWEDRGCRLVQIVLLGQPELRQRLQEPKWEPLRQRIVLSYHLGRLELQDVIRYVDHRLRMAGGRDDMVSFSEEALAAIHAAAEGTPRLINVLCDNALLVGYSRGVHRLERDIIDEVLRDMTCWGLNAAESRHPESYVGR